MGERVSCFLRSREERTFGWTWGIKQAQETSQPIRLSLEWRSGVLPSLLSHRRAEPAGRPLERADRRCQLTLLLSSSKVVHARRVAHNERSCGGGGGGCRQFGMLG